ncbi:ATP-grasp domain-containing protein [Methylophaga sp. OBS3]|uniref:ATP-grasp domain-containing protein n=1 Tax=Methylophaga sp. OBS3 TaxID=2991934 RepID=UPI00225A7639|nr:ATP-grasp domain-containing protein [Methylophaga sp. OBS3]MCX4189929.1 ATP-grasp domain-containing protein [Methylophaga sp. OBS3]
MKIVVYEYFTSGALLNRDFSSELAHEGDEMLQAVINDMLSNTSFQPTVIRDARLPPLNNINNIRVDSVSAYQQAWQQCLEEETRFLLIAPETEGVLASLATQVLNAGRQLLGTSPKTTALCTNKLECSQKLASTDISTIPTQTAENWLAQPAFLGALICKPIDGAGCVDTYLFESEIAAAHYLHQCSHHQRQTIIVQPFISGTPMSLSVFFADKPHILSCNQQIITGNNQLTYEGSIVNLPFPNALTKVQATTMLTKLRSLLPELWGFVGVDLIVNEDEYWIVDINPRLTTSFNQLSQLETSPAQRLFNALAENEFKVSND